MEKINNNNSAVTIGVFAHANAGKTTVTEQLLYNRHIIDVLGRVDEGNTCSDSLTIERNRGISVRASLVSFLVGEKKVQLIDTPGHIDFSAEVERALTVLDCAILVISGVEGIEAQTYTLWKLLKEKKIPIIIFINKIDRLGADYDRVIGEIKNKIEKKVISLVNLRKINDKIVYKEYSHEQMLDIVTSFDDGILTEYLKDPEKITPEYLNIKLKQLIKQGKIFGIIGGSALKGEGIELLIGTMEKFLPSLEFNDGDELSAFIYLVRVDNGIKNYYTKILSGKLSKRDLVQVHTENEDKIKQKIKGLSIIDGINFVPTDNVSAGDIVIINGIDAKCGDYIGVKPENSSYTKFVNPLIHMNVLPKGKITSSELFEALNILNIEDPDLNVKYDKHNNQIIISLMGEIQAQVIKTMLMERFSIDSDFVDPILIHKEKPSKPGVGLASYTTVSAVQIEVNPLPSGSGIIYRSKLSTDFLLKKYQNQVERLVKFYIKQGLYGWEVSDAEISLIDGRFDSMGSDPKHFNIAIPLALMRTFKNCNMKIIEPISIYTIIIPRENLNKVINYLSRLNIAFEIIDKNTEQLIITGEAKCSDMLDFPNLLISITSGRGVFSSYISRYELSKNQNITRPYIGPDPRNETVFVIEEMQGSLDALDKPISKKKRPSSSKFQRKKREKQFKENK